MANIKFPENRITELVRKTIDEYNAEIMRGWTKEERKKLIPIFLPDYRGYGFRTYSYDPFLKLDQLDIDNPECVNNDLYKILRRFKRGKCGAGLGEREALSTFNNAYAYTLDALNHSHPETRYNEYFEKYYFFHADVEIIKAFVYVLLSGERHRFPHTSLLLEDLEYGDKEGTIQYFAKALGIPFASSATDPRGDDWGQGEDASPQEARAKSRSRTMIFKDEATALHWAKVVNDTLAEIQGERFVNSILTLQLATIVSFDYWWSLGKNIYPKNKLPSTPNLFDFFRMHCSFTATETGEGEYKTAYNGINRYRIREDTTKNTIKEAHRSLWDKIKDAVLKNT